MDADIARSDNSEMPTEAEVASCFAAAANKEVKPAAGGKTRVSVLMSGGVDSSTTALLLKQAGYDVIGVTGWLIKSGSRCCDTGMIDAARVAEQLGIDHHAVDLREMFKHQIIDQFHESYAVGKTPLPCSLCNTLVKWGALFQYSKKVLAADYIATGHYARIVQREDGAALARALDRTKDQSYVLWGLTRDQLQSTLLPLGDYTKDEIRKIAGQHELASANRPDSQDLCFIPKGTTAQEYLAQFLDEQPGPLVNALTGAVVGEHKGTHNYTIGQRRGIGISTPEPTYVTHIDPESRTVYVGSKEALLRSELTASQVNWLVANAPTEPFEALAKIRYNSATVPAIVYPSPDAAVRIVFKDPQPAVTPGQVLGIYDQSDTFLIGGGWID